MWRHLALLFIFVGFWIYLFFIFIVLSKPVSIITNITFYKVISSLFEKLYEMNWYTRCEFQIHSAIFSKYVLNSKHKTSKNIIWAWNTSCFMHCCQENHHDYIFITSSDQVWNGKSAWRVDVLRALSLQCLAYMLLLFFSWCGVCCGVVYASPSWYLINPKKKEVYKYFYIY